jgi:hypothetical protein
MSAKDILGKNEMIDEEQHEEQQQKNGNYDASAIQVLKEWRRFAVGPRCISVIPAIADFIT